MEKIFRRIIAIQIKIESIIDQNEQIKKGKWLFFSEKHRWKRINSNLHRLNHYYNLKLEAFAELETQTADQKKTTNNYIKITDLQIIASKDMIENSKPKIK